MASSQSSGLCPIPTTCCGTNCCEPSLCESCVADICQVQVADRPLGANCNFNCQCISGNCTGFVCV